MSKVSFLLIGLKGYSVLKYAVENHLDLIDFVVYGLDSGVESDYSDEIKLLCKSKNIICIERQNIKAEFENYDKYKIAAALC